LGEFYTLSLHDALPISQRKAGFHWLAESFAKKLSWDVLFVTAPISLVSWLIGDHRFKYPVFEQKNEVVRVGNNIWSYVYLTILGDRKSTRLNSSHVKIS